MSDLVGKSLGRYHILESLGEGGMAVVYKALDTHLETYAAVKVIRTENILPSALERSLKRFEREAKSLARLSHPNIVKILDYGEQDGKPYLVMPFLSGGTLKERLKQGGMDWKEAAQLLLPVAQALAYAHEQNLIHRDVKPSNILLTEDGEPMLTDFGIAKILDMEETTELTGTSMAIGTPEYMAPEQATAKTVDHRADTYSLGIVLYEMVTGRKPFMADTPLAVLFKHASEPLPRPTKFQPNLPDALERILVKALAKRPEDRYQNMTEMALALEKFLNGQPIQAEAGNAETIDELSVESLPVPPLHPSAPDDRRLVPPVMPRGFNNRSMLFGVMGIGVFILLSAAVWLAGRNNNPSTPEPLMPVYSRAITETPVTITLIDDPTITPEAKLDPITPTYTVTATFTAKPDPITPTYTSTPSRPDVIVCPNALPTRLRVGMEIQVTTSGLVPKLGIRPKPNLDSHKMFELQSGSRMTILDGPVCSNDSYFWFVSTSSGNGWVREGNTEFYFVDPL